MHVVGGDRVAVGVPLHAGVAVALEPTEVAVVGDPELRHRLVELDPALVGEGVVLVGGQVLELGHQDLAHLATGAGDEGDADALGDVPGHGRALADGLVVGVRVHEEEVPA